MLIGKLLLNQPPNMENFQSSKESEMLENPKVAPIDRTQAQKLRLMGRSEGMRIFAEGAGSDVNLGKEELRKEINVHSKDILVAPEQILEHQ
jgi:hypothetical protein